MAAIRCKVCYARYEEEFDICPYCGTSNREKVFLDRFFPGFVPMATRIKALAVFVLMIMFFGGFVCCLWCYNTTAEPILLYYDNDDYKKLNLNGENNTIELVCKKTGVLSAKFGDADSMEWITDNAAIVSLKEKGDGESQNTVKGSEVFIVGNATGQTKIILIVADEGSQKDQKTDKYTINVEVTDPQTKNLQEGS